MLPDPKGGGFNREGTIATGLLAIGNWGNGDADKEKILTDIADDQVDVVSRTVMGLTVACARCHDHKFDPISTKDYYGMAGIFFSTHILPKLAPKGAGENPLKIPLESPAQIKERERYTARSAELEKQLLAERQSQYRKFAESMLSKTPDYALAAWDFAHQNSAMVQALEEFAAGRGLLPFALRQWLGLMGQKQGVALTTFVPKVLNSAGVMAWRGQADCPNVTVNLNDTERRLLTFILPPRSVSVHPAPMNSVAVAWRSPISGTVAVRGKVADADPAGGNGVQWAIERSSEIGTVPLAKGEIANGKSQAISGDSLTEIAVRAGERILLVVSPLADYTCDTTHIELEISEQKTGRVWNLTRDVLDKLAQKGNTQPLADTYGNADVWAFSELEDGGQLLGGTLAKAWRAAAEEASSNVPKLDLEARRDAIRWAGIAVQNALKENTESPFFVQREADEGSLPPSYREPIQKIVSEREQHRKNPPPPIEYANGAQDGGCPESPYAGFHDVRVHKRGNYATLGDVVPRAVPAILAENSQIKVTAGSGRLELAQWLTSPNHPLTARVISNRIWQYHFGRGIVNTPSNFGLLGERPSNPELLDYLASELVSQGWSLKRLHRQILLSNCYRQSSATTALTRKLDADNRLFGRQNRRRLEAEAIRDSLLAVGGKLDIAQGGRSIRDGNAPRRTIYITTIRSDRSGFSSLFDGADASACIDKRNNTTVAPQALYLLNNDFLTAQANLLAARLQQNKQTNAETIQYAYRVLYGRPAKTAEVQIGEQALNKARLSGVSSLEAWQNYAHLLLCANEFFYVD